MALFHHRWLFWDGVENVSPAGDVDVFLNDFGWLDYPSQEAIPPEKIGDADAIPVSRLAAKTAGKRVIDTDEPVSVEIVEVDPFFVPVRDLMAIHLRLGGLSNIEQMMLRVFACKDTAGNPVEPSRHFRLVHQVLLYKADIAKLPKSDVSLREPNARKKAREDEHAAGQGGAPVAAALRCMTHCRIEVWVHKKKRVEGAKSLYLDLDGNNHPSYDDAVAIHDKKLPLPPGAAPLSDRIGRNESTAGCALVESIMAGETAIKIYDHEPDDELSDGRKGDGVTVYPDFRRQIKNALYQICRHSKIGTALLRDVAQSDKSVHLFPSTQVAKFIEGVGTNPPQGVLHDKHVSEKVAAAELDIRNAHRVDTSPAALTIDKFTLPTKFAKKPTLQEKWLACSATKLAYDDLGASNGQGCESRYFFHPVNMLKIDADNYGVQMFREERVVDIPELGRKVVIAKPCITQYDKFRPQIIETPFFLALIHELVHARRFQLGRNGEWDAFGSSGSPHPGSLLAKLDGRRDGDRANFLLRYSNFNLEEYDTIEGNGAPVTVDDATFQDLVALGVLKPTDSKKLNVTENLARKELGLIPRLKYQPGLTLANDTVEVADADLPERKFVKPRRSAPRPQPLVTTDFSAIQNEANALLKELGLVERAVPMKEGVNYFKFADPQFGWAYAYGQTYTTPKARTDYANILFDEIYSRRKPAETLAATLGVTDPAIRASLAMMDVDAKPATEAERLDLTRGLMRTLIFSTAADDLSRLMKIPQLKDMSNVNSYSAGIQAFAATKVMHDPDLDAISDRAFYTPDVNTDDPRHLCHMLIHEPMHMHAYKGQGFTAWDFGGKTLVDPENASDLKTTFNEGMTELLARIITYRLNCKKGEVVSKVQNFGGLPSYEYPTHLVTRVVRDLDAANNPGDGLKILAAAFFDGVWAPLNDALERLYDKKFLTRVSRIEHQGGRYFAPIKNQPAYDAVSELKTANGLDWELPEQLKINVANGTYRDPVLHPTPLVRGIDCKLAPAPVVVPPANLETECFDCGAPIEVLATDIRKAAS